MIEIAVPAPPDITGICALRISGLAPAEAYADDEGASLVEEAAEALRMAIATDSWPIVFACHPDVTLEWVIAA